MVLTPSRTFSGLDYLCVNVQYTYMHKGIGLGQDNNNPQHGIVEGVAERWGGQGGGLTVGRDIQMII